MESPDRTTSAQQPETIDRSAPAAPANTIVATILQDHWSKNEGNKQKYSLIFGILAKKNKIYEALLNAAKTFPETTNGKRKRSASDSRPFRLLKARRLASWVLPRLASSR